MADRVGSYHPSVATARGRLVRRGGTRRPAVEVPADGDLARPTGETARLVVDGRERHAPVVEGGAGWILAGAFDNARRARAREGTDRLAEWVAARGLDLGRSVLVDAVSADEVYGLREPGERAVYDVVGSPAASLRGIAEDLDG